MKLNVVEVFSSVQGEGIYVGTRQMFVRLAGCNMVCKYCDTPSSHSKNSLARLEVAPGTQVFKQTSAEMEITELSGAIDQLLLIPHHSVSITGGEPLCQAEALAELLPMIKCPVYLETNGTLPEKLIKVLPYVKFISMDIKLPHTCNRSYWEEHRKFLQIASERNVFVKLVVDSETKNSDIINSCELISAVNSHIPLVIQPVTPVGGCIAPKAELIAEWQMLALKQLTDVRIIPQTHKIQGFL